MHEASLMRNLMGKILEVAEREGAQRVVAIEVRLGALSHMSEEHFQEHFDQSASGTIAEGAVIRATVESDIHAPHAPDVMLESVEVE